HLVFKGTICSKAPDAPMQAKVKMNFEFDYSKLELAINGISEKRDLHSDKVLPLVQLIETLPFYSIRKNPIVLFGNGFADVRPEPLARQVWRFAKKNGSAAALKALDALVKIEEIEVATYAFIEGAQTNAPIEIGDDITALPESQAHSTFFSKAISELKPGIIDAEGCILVVKERSDPFRSLPDGADTTLLPADFFPKYNALTRLETAARVITVAGPTAAAIRAHTFRVLGNQLDILGMTEGVSYQYPDFSSIRNKWQINTEIKGIFEQYKNFDQKSINRIDTAIDRLNFACAHSNRGSSIIDAAIALETLLGDQGSRQELSYRLKLRCALLMKNDLEERKKISNFVRELYAKRSQMVHQGQITITEANFTRDAVNLVSSVIKKCLFLGGIPDWPTLELSGKATLPSLLEVK
ncbi:MAG: hypothetical protein ACFBZ9_09075, partial [Sphingomonadales bacterium]